ncbi:MAG TPA: hypothetical protein VGR32_07070 [Brevundimonas sp.]|jgi:hypothetical protein|uniref:hypothetical protein n=1 Tax=Brevundimonas sp. TaxID=1871086 RepID=UPI002DF1EFFF|nr:hypothetical protein [Brevundimonas sp.]
MTSRLARFLLASLLALLVAAAATFGAARLWELIGGAPMSVHGWVALGLGMFGSVALAWALMALAFKSSREGWDDRVDNTLDPGREREED